MLVEPNEICVIQVRAVVSWRAHCWSKQLKPELCVVYAEFSGAGGTRGTQQKPIPSGSRATDGTHCSGECSGIQFKEQHLTCWDAWPQKVTQPRVDQGQSEGLLQAAKATACLVCPALSCFWFVSQVQG